MSNTQWYIGKEKGIEHILTRPVNAAAAPQAHESAWPYTAIRLIFMIWAW